MHASSDRGPPPCISVRIHRILFHGCCCNHRCEIVTMDIGWTLPCECQPKPKRRLSSFVFYHLMLFVCSFL
uniref:Uncharacterized protein n=1 Tax=Haemonchus contortus TaxID=6289 RepID=A0A7I4Z5P6_HAECO